MKSYLAINSPLRSPSADELDGHLAFLAALEQSDQLLLSGPFLGGGGAYVFRAESRTVAEDLIGRDPFKSTGQSAYTVHEWAVDGAGFASAS